MFDRGLRAIAGLASAVIVLSFALFAVEEVRDASERQQSAVVDPGGDAERRRAAGHTAAREAVDDANDVILKPFAGVTGADNPWARRGIPALLGLLVYGLGLAYLARRLDVRRHTFVRHAPPPAPAAAQSSKPPPTL
ncbi:MAG TPA: hypothetical protein VNB64_01835 [Solirubrobacteraceae bacterium]|nr:hypothetical protein [Solirubrobacteraceae bacterium]